MLNKDARNPCWASFDGHHQLEVCPGDRCVNFLAPHFLNFISLNVLVY